MDEFEHLQIRLEEIKKATSNFSDNVIIGSGGFGKVYVGEISHSKGRSMVAIKRLDRKFGQGDSEFWKEIMMLSRYTHKNLISLLGFCDEDDEKILVYEHASNGSLDRHLSSTSLTWTQRIRICVDAAKGLSYLHDHKGSQQRILHRDIKSANILLDHNWNAKVSDMGLSKLGPANQPHTLIFTNVVGTAGYCDPQYMMTYMLTKESDVYSFGVVLFEVLSGRLCYKVDSNHQVHILVPMWKESYKHKKLDKIIFNDLTPSIDKTSLETFAGIAYKCVHESREQRPQISFVVKELETALKFQELYDMKTPKKYDNEEIVKDVETPSKDIDHEDLSSKGKRIVVDAWKTRNLIADVVKIVEKNKSCRWKDELRKVVAEGLLLIGYDASVCKTRWEKSSSCPAGEYTYIDVILQGRDRMLVDIDFRSEFEIARPTTNYKAILQSLSPFFVGDADRLQQILSVVSEKVKMSMKTKGMHLPPWRKIEYLRSKWLSAHIRTPPLLLLPSLTPVLTPAPDTNAASKQIFSENGVCLFGTQSVCAEAGSSDVEVGEENGGRGLEVTNS